MKDNIAGNIRDARKAKGLSGSDLASLLGVSHQTIYRWENSKGYPDVKQLESLSEALNRPPEYFLRGRGQEQRDTVAIQVPREYAQEVVRFLDLLKRSPNFRASYPQKFSATDISRTPSALACSIQRVANL